MPAETLLESAPCDRSTRIAIEQFFHSVSGGKRFRSIFDILVDETLALVREDHSVVAIAPMGSGWGGRDEAARIARESHSQIREDMKRRVEEYASTSRDEDMPIKDILHRTSLERCGMFFRDLQKFAAIPRPADAVYEVPWLMSGLITLGLTLAEAWQLGEAVRLHRWEAIPVNYFDLLLGSRWEHDSMHGQRPNYEPNDEIDRRRAAVALGHSDLFITDSYTADLCRRSKVADYAPTIVFSTKQADAILEFIRKSA